MNGAWELWGGKVKENVFLRCERKWFRKKEEVRFKMVRPKNVVVSAQWMIITEKSQKTF